MKEELIIDQLKKLMNKAIKHNEVPISCIITKDNKRWEIQNVTYQRSWRGSVTWQQFDIKAFPVTDPIYSHPQLKTVDGTKLYQKKQLIKLKPH